MNVPQKQILIVEDEAAHAEAIARAFRKGLANAALTISGSLQEYRLAITRGLRPDIVLMDLNLPDGSAMDALAAHDGDQAWPIVIMTAYGDEKLAVAAMKAGALDYIVKSSETFAGMPQVVERALREWTLLQQQKVMEKSLRESEQRFRTLFQDIQTVAVQGYTEEGTIRFWNLASEKLYGYSAAEALGRNLLELLVPPEQHEALRAAIREMAATGQAPPGGELTLVRKNGSTVTVYSNHTILRKPGAPAELFCFDIDLTERKRAEAELQKLSLAVEQSPAAVMITDPCGVIEYVNPRFTRITGYALEEILGRDADLLTSVSLSPEQIRELRKILATGQEWQGELHSRRKDGGSFWESMSISPVRDPVGTITHYVAVREDITERKRHEAELEYLSTHDELTGLANRALLQDRLEQAVRHAYRSGHLVAVMLLDLDRFKFINDSLGHAFGDELLRSVAQRLQRSVREVDTVARLGGDEFVLLLTELTAAENARLLAGKILGSLESPHRLQGREVTLTASLGISIAPYDGCDVATLISNADIAMYQAKKNRGTFAFYAAEMNQRVCETLELESALRLALERQELFLHYQPKVDLASGRMVGCEALLRWQHPERGLVAPAEFIPLAEETGLIVPIGRWVLQEVIRQVKAWQGSGLETPAVAVNISARQFRTGDLPHLIRKILADSGLEPGFLESELTESMIMDDPAKAEMTLRAVKDLGVSLSLDDFGMGYSSLNYLRRFPFDNLKIDRSFIRDATSNASEAAVVTSIISIAHNLGIAAIAEGVETQRQLAFLRQNGCDTFQGYLFSKPLPAEQFADLLREDRRLPDAWLQPACSQEIC